jgi:hypothetical protein
VRKVNLNNLRDLCMNSSYFTSYIEVDDWDPLHKHLIGTLIASNTACKSIDCDFRLGFFAADDYNQQGA